MYPFEKAVEQNPSDWWAAVCESTKALIAESRVRNADIACVCFSAQMMGCLLVDGSGEPLRNMIIWADTRSGKQEREMIDSIGLERGYRITGHRLSASYSAAKLLWVKEHEPEIYRDAAKMIHAKDYIIFRLTGALATDYSDASGTNLLDIASKRWSEELVTAFGIRPDLLPELRASTDLAGYVTLEAAAKTGLLEGTPVIMGGGDGSCACVGAGVVSEGTAYNVLGSSAWISMATREPYFDPSLRTFNWVHLDKSLYTPCGTMQAAGLSYSWFRDTFCESELKDAADSGSSAHRRIDELVRRSPVGANGLLYLPYLMGERSPRWNIDARGAFVGMGISTSRADFARSVLEGVGFNLKAILDIFDESFGIGEITVIGGGAKGNAWLRILSDIWEKPLSVPRYLEEATSMGAAVCGGVGIGAYRDFSVMRELNRRERLVSPDPETANTYRRMYKAFNQAYFGLVETYETLMVK